MSLFSQRSEQAIATSAGAPQVRLLHASAAGVDEHRLREWARAHPDARSAPYVTRSYCFPYALVAWHQTPVGVDVERVAPCDASFAESICTPSEQLDWASLPDRDAYVTSMWSSKEAVAKALGDALSYDPRRLQAPMLWPQGRAGVWAGMRLALPDRRCVAWLCWRLQRS